MWDLRRLSAVIAAVICVATGVMLGPGVTSAAPGPTPAVANYVALGDSRALSPTWFSPLNGCGATDGAYPVALAGLLHARSTVNRACVNATAANVVDTRQLTTHGYVPPQVDALRPTTDLVTISIGGNDMGWWEAISACFSNIPGKDVRCRNDPAIRSRIDARLAVVSGRIERVLDAVEKRAPNATAVVVGHGGYFGTTGCAQANASSADLAFINSTLFGGLNGELRTAAQRHHARYIDVMAGAVGHDVCAGRQAWFQGNRPDSSYQVRHPNARGGKGIAELIARQLRG